MEFNTFFNLPDNSEFLSEEEFRQAMLSFIFMFEKKDESIPYDSDSDCALFILSQDSSFNGVLDKETKSFIRQTLFGDAVIGSTEETDEEVYEYEDEEEPEESGWGSFDEEEEDEDEEVDWEKELAEDLEEEEVSEEVTSSQDEDSYFAEVYDGMYSSLVKEAVNTVVERYTNIFEAGYQLKKPIGVMGNGVLYSLSGSVLQETVNDQVVRAVDEIITKKMGLTICDSRSVSEIANTVIFGAPNDGYSGNKLGGRLYFPRKMLEYAYGRQQPSSDNINGNTNYEQSASASSWGSYVKTEITPSLTNLFAKTIQLFLRNNLKPGDAISDMLNEEIKEVIGRMRDSLSTCVLISEYNKKHTDILRIRVLDPYNSLPREINLAKKVCEKAFNSDGGKASLSREVVSDNVYVEYVHEMNHMVYNAEPLYAFKALDVYKEQGIQVGWDNMLIGMTSDGKIMKVAEDGSGIPLKRNLSHSIVAGSRSGKGLMTLLLTANALISGKPVFYLDNKPDMASLFKYLSPECFVMNGNNVIPGSIGKKDGTDYFCQFENVNSLVRSDTPEYFRDFEKSLSYNDLGDIYYTRALNLVMAILCLRVERASDLSNLGGENGIVIVVDELSNTSKGFNNSMMMMQRVMAGSGYYQKYKAFKRKERDFQIEYDEWVDAGGAGKPPKQPDVTKIDLPKPTKGGYWFAAFVESLRKSMNKVYSLDNAGLKNTEAGKSDIFILSQDLFDPITDLGEVDYLFPKRNKNDNAPSSRPSKSDILPSLCMVGGSDAFIGYNVNHKSYLAQNNVNSPTYGKLDDKARNFAYVDGVKGIYKKKIEDGDLGTAKSSIPFKPFLLLSDNKEDEYFVQNSMKYAEMAGLQREDIVARNEDPSNPGHLDPRIGFVEYIASASNGIDLSGVLAQSGRIANYVLNRIGYNGSWQDYIFDLRPEWILSIQDIIDAYDTGNVANVIEGFPEFTYVYPEAFGLTFDQVERYYNDGGKDEDMLDLDREVSDEEVSSSGFFNYDDFFDSTEESSNDGGNWYDNRVSPTPQFVNTPVNTAGSGQVITPVSFREEFSKIVYPEADSYEEIHNVYPRGLDGVTMLISDITNQVIERQGGEWGIESISVLGGKLIVNGEMVSPRFAPNSLINIPHHYVRRINEGLFAKLFNFNRLTSCQNLREMSFSSYEEAEDAAEFFSKRFINGKSSAQLLFDEINSLRILKIGTSVITRDSYEDEKPFYRSKARSSLDTACGNLRNTIWGFTKNTVTSDNHKILSKMLLGTIGVGAIGVVSSLQAASRVSTGLKGIFKAFKDVGRS